MKKKSLKRNYNFFLRAGVAKSDITTRKKGVRINDPLYAKVLVLDNKRKQVVIIEMDTVAIGGIYDIGDDFLPKLRDQIEKKLKIQGQNVLVNASHTHPPGKQLLCDDVIERTFDAVKRALKNLEPVKIGVGIGYEDRIMINRNLILKNGKHWTIRHAYPCPPDEEVIEIGPIDPEIGIIKIDRMNDTPLCVLFNFACHPLIGVPDGSITANYPGFASKIIEETLGNNCMVLFLQGAGGDITEVLYKDVNRPRDAEPIGTMLGLSVLKSLKKIKTKKETKLNVISETITLPRRSDIPEIIKSLKEEQNKLLKSLRFTSLNFKTFLPLYIKNLINSKYPSDYFYRYLHEEKIGSNDILAMDVENRKNIKKYLKNIYIMEKLAVIQDKIETLKFHQNIINKSNNKIPTEIQGIKIGDCVLITSPAELLVEIGLNIKKISPYKYTFIAAYSNGYIYYGSPVSYYNKGGYEVTECQLSPEWQEIYEKKAIEIIRKL